MIKEANLCFRFKADWTGESVGQLWNIWEMISLWLKMKILSLYRMTSCRPVAPVLFVCLATLCCTLDLSFLTRDWICTVEVWNLNHWIAKEVPCLFVFLKIYFWKLLSGIIWQWCTTLTTWVNIAALPWLGLWQIQLALHIRGSHVCGFNQLWTKISWKLLESYKKQKLNLPCLGNNFCNICNYIYNYLHSICILRYHE